MFRCLACGALNRVPEHRPDGQATCGRCHGALDLSGAPQEVGEDGLHRAIRSSPIPVLVDFWAPWCSPCRAAAPILDALARERAGRLLVLKLNTDTHPEAARPHGISGIPTFIVFRGGEEVSRRSGAMPLPTMREWLAASTA